MPIDVTEHTFQAEVLDRSATLPVVVDFWAAWCAPCRQLTPLLEAQEAQRQGKVVLAKVDTEANPRISQAFAVQSIPAVKAFRDAKIVDEFTGVHPAGVLTRFFDKLVPSEADGLVAAGDEASLRRALELEPGRADAAVGLARILHKRGDSTEAFGLVDAIRGNFAAEGLASRMRLEESGTPDLASAFEALDASDHAAAVDALLAALADAGDARDDVRQVLVGLLDELGVEHPLARDARRRLAAALY